MRASSFGRIVKKDKVAFVRAEVETRGMDGCDFPRNPCRSLDTGHEMTRMLQQITMFLCISNYSLNYFFLLYSISENIAKPTV